MAPQVSWCISALEADDLQKSGRQVLRQLDKREATYAASVQIPPQSRPACPLATELSEHPWQYLLVVLEAATVAKSRSITAVEHPQQTV